MCSDLQLGFFVATIGETIKHKHILSAEDMKDALQDGLKIDVIKQFISFHLDASLQIQRNDELWSDSASMRQMFWDFLFDCASLYLRLRLIIRTMKMAFLIILGATFIYCSNSSFHFYDRNPQYPGGYGSVVIFKSKTVVFWMQKK